MHTCIHIYIYTYRGRTYCEVKHMAQWKRWTGHVTSGILALSWRCPKNKLWFLGNRRHDGIGGYTK